MAIWTQADVDTLKAAVATGVLSVEYSGPPARRITYHSLAEMRSLLASMVADVGANAGTRKNYTLISTKKGL